MKKIKKYRIAYDALFNYWGNALFFRERKVAGVAVFFEIRVFKDELELYFGKEEPLDISFLKILHNGLTKKKIWLIDLIDCTIDKKQGFRIEETVYAKQLRNKGFSFSIKPWC